MKNAAIVGLGWWGKAIVDAVQNHSQHLRFTHGAVRNPDKVADFAEKHGLQLHARYEDVLADPTVDAVVLATPHSLHPDQVVAAAQAGKHVFCEKPLAMTAADALRAVRACAAAGRVLGVGQNKRFWASMVALREIVQSGELGQILHVEGHSSNQNSSNFAAWREVPEEAPGGGMTGSGIHVLDALISVAGPASRVNAQLLKAREGRDPRDTVTVMFEFANGISGTLAAVRATPLYWRVHVFGDQGSVESLSESGLVIRRNGGAVERRDVPLTNSIRVEMDAFAQAIAGGQPFPISTAEMVQTAAAFEAVLRSIETQQPINVPQETT